MADPLSSISLAVSLVVSVAQAADFARKVIGQGLTLAAAPGYEYRRTRFGTIGHLLYFSTVVDIDTLQEFHWNINTWTDEEVMTWKQSQLSTYSAIAVAVGLKEEFGLAS